ncbi:unnamed protein product [Peniophora sp. CBMAI 1063]|nr:unnamed protein product [Peniophora sp. CBMAI 1063]
MIFTRLSIISVTVSAFVAASALDLPYHDSTYDIDKRDPAVFPQHSPGNGYEYYSSYDFGYGYMTTAQSSPQSTRAATAQVAGVTGRSQDHPRPRARFH